MSFAKKWCVEKVALEHGKLGVWFLEDALFVGADAGHSPNVTNSHPDKSVYQNHGDQSCPGDG